MAYTKKVIDHFENPRNVGSWDKGDERIGSGLVGAPECGDVLQLQLKVDDNNCICDARCNPFGCGSAIAASSLATELVKVKTLTEAANITNS